MRSTRPWNFWLIPLLASCSTGGGHSEAVQSVDRVIANESTFIGTFVIVDGYLRFGDDSHNLWADHTAYLAVANHDPPPDDPAWSRCIALYGINGWWETLLKNNGRQVRVRGILQRHVPEPEEVNLSECSDLGLAIKSVTRSK